MRNFLKILVVPAGLALASFSTAMAAPGTASPPPAVEIDVSRGGEAVTPVDHTYRHTREQQRWRNYNRRYYTPAPRYSYQPRYAPPRCYWSRAYQRRVCRY